MTCQYCGGAVSAKKAACPHCGAPMPTAEQVAPRVPEEQQKVVNMNAVIDSGTDANTAAKFGWGIFAILIVCSFLASGTAGALLFAGAAATACFTVKSTWATVIWFVVIVVSIVAAITSCD